MEAKNRQRCLTVAILFSLAASAAHAGIAEIVGLTGKGEYRPDGETAWRDAKLKQKLEPAWWVRTAASSTMALMVDPETQVRLDANSIFQLKRDDKASGTTLNLRQGRSWSQSKQPGGTVRMETPSAIAAIHGTDWEMVVDSDGRSTLTVVHGRVHFANERGSVTVGNGEQGVAEPGKAPVVRRIANPAERVQWVTALRVEPLSYPEFAQTPRREIADLVSSGQMDEATQRLKALPQRGPADDLLLADMAMFRGDHAEAARLLRTGAADAPDDPRFVSALSRLALLGGDGGEALRVARAACERFPHDASIWLTRGEAARFEGLAGEARDAYQRAARLAPTDARPWLGLGRIAAEQGDIGLARRHLEKAAELDARLPELAAERGRVETLAFNHELAFRHFAAALTDDAQDYLAMTALARLRLAEGRNEEAQEHLLRANLLEPRHAEAYLDRAVVHHRRGESAVALEFLRQASERDRNDPMPHFMASLVHQDRGELFAAVEAARQAREKLPYLKSLTPLSVDQKGSANVGSALARLELSQWARFYAQESHDPLWAGSHFFLADRYSGYFNKSSELFQGYLTDPLAFGASNRWQTLMPSPGAYLTLGARASRGDASRYAEPSLVANGSGDLGFPVAAFFEALRNDVRPGNQDFSATGDAYTLALGAKPRHDLSLFVFGNRFTPDIEQMGARFREHIDGTTQRLDAGGSYRPNPDTEIWLKAGNGTYDAHTRSLGNATRQDIRREGSDTQGRFTWRPDRHELTMGIERADANSARMTRGNTIAIPRNEEDDYRAFYLQGRYAPTPTWQLEAGLAATDYRKADITNASIARYREQRVQPLLGAAWRPAAELVVRAAYQDWTRSAAPHSLRPVAVAGIPIDDQLVLPGGRLQRLRLQADWEASKRLFGTVFVDERKVRNLGTPGFVLNTAEEVSDPNRLRDRGLFQSIGDPESLEGQPVFAQGRARLAGVVTNAIVGGGLAASSGYIHTSSRNEGGSLRGDPLPYLPRHRLHLGLTWSNEALFTVGGWLTWRSARETAEINGTTLPASWDMALKLKWESADKRWQLDGWAANLLKKGDGTVLGIGATWRY